MSFFTYMKSKMNILSKSNVVYQFSCPGCESSYFGKTERTLFERTKEHVTRADSAIKRHLDNCSNVEHLFSINDFVLNDANTHEFRLSLVCQNKEAYHIKEKCPILNDGVGSCVVFLVHGTILQQ